MKTQNEFLALPDEKLTALGISTKDAMAAIEQAVLAKAQGKLWVTPKSALLPGDGRYMMTTLSASDDPGVLVVKAVMVQPKNAARNLAGVNGAILVLDSDTGMLLATLGANWVTAVRTAGLSAVVAKRLANPKSQSIAFIGAGTEARSHLDAFAELFPLKDVRIFGRGQANIDRLKAAAAAKGLSATQSSDPRAVVEGADLIVSSVTLNYELKPFVDARWLKPGAFASITDLALPWEPAGMDAFSTVVIDDSEQERQSPKPMVDAKLVAGDLTDLVSDKIKPAFDPASRAAFVFRGIAIGDFALAALAYRRALGRS